MTKRVALALALSACGCGGSGGTAHAPVDPALDLSIVVPDNMKRVEVDFVHVERSDVFPDAAAFAADQAAHNSSHEVGEPSPDGDGWVVTLTSRDHDFPGTRVWYRPLGDGLAITCFPIKAMGAPTDADYALTRKVCAGVQRVDRGVFVPFQRSRSSKSTGVELAVVGGPLNWHVELERTADSPSGRFAPRSGTRDEPLIDRGSLPDGEWWLYGGKNDIGSMHYDAITRRTIGGVELACSGDDYHDEQYTRRQLALCKAIGAP